MSTPIDDTDWSDSLDDAEPGEWETFLAGPNDNQFDESVDRLADSSFSHNYDDEPEVTLEPLEQRITELQQHIEILSLYVGASRAAFEYALQNSDLVLVRKMLESGFNPDTRRHNSRTALMRAVYKNDIGLAELLLEFGADPQAVDVDFDSPIKTALKTGGDMAALIVQHVLRPRIYLDVNDRDEYWVQSRFHIIPDDGYVQTDPEVEPFTDNRVSRTLLEWCVEFGLTDIFSLASSAEYDVFGPYSAESSPPSYHPDESWEVGYDLSILIAPPDPLLELVKRHGRLEIAEQLLRVRDARLRNADQKVESLSVHEQSMLKANHLENLAWFKQTTGIGIEPCAVNMKSIVIPVAPFRAEPDDLIPF